MRDGEAAHRVSACHRPPVLVEVPALNTALAVWWVCLAAARRRRRRRYAQCHHHASLSTLLLSAVHPVTLYTPTQPSTVPLQALCGAVCSLTPASTP
jgi:hypothetical protein